MLKHAQRLASENAGSPEYAWAVMVILRGCFSWGCWRRAERPRVEIAERVQEGQDGLVGNLWVCLYSR